jgi:hypothetical protein
MKTALWISQALFAGVSKFVMTPEQMQGPLALPVLFIRFIGLCEVLAAFGLILPSLLRIQPWLTPLAAAGLVVIMAGATVITAATMTVALAILPFVLGLLAAFVAYGRWKVVPIQAR